MRYEQILNLLNRGLTPADIVALSQQPAPDPAPVTGQQPAPDPAPVTGQQPAPDPAPVPGQQPAPAPEWVESLNQNIVRMTNALHANAIMQQQQPEQHQVTADEALANIIAPPKSEKAKK